MTSLRIAFAGTPEFSVPALRALTGSPHVVAGVLTRPDRPSGRGRKVMGSAVKAAASELGLPIAQPLSLKETTGREALLAWKPDVLVVVAYGLILPREVLELPRLGCVNIHASLLPRWRGAAPIQRAILVGDTETGVTIMQMDAGLDTGPMLVQRRVSIDERETSGALHGRLAQLGASSLLEALEGLADGVLQPTPQPADGVTYAAKISKAEALVDWSEQASAIARKVRAFNPWPIAETRYAGEQLRILAAHAEGLVSDTKELKYDHIDSNMNQYGVVFSLQDDVMRVRCGRGSLAVTQVQRAGKKPVAAVDFARSGELLGKRLG